ncbi:hypothetical protein ABPG72_016895 [Tetrahymena utriculariae]
MSLLKCDLFSSKFSMNVGGQQIRKGTIFGLMLQILIFGLATSYFIYVLEQYFTNGIESKASYLRVKLIQHLMIAYLDLGLIKLLTINQHWSTIDNIQSQIQVFTYGCLDLDKLKTTIPDNCASQEEIDKIVNGINAGQRLKLLTSQCFFIQSQTSFYSPIQFDLQNQVLNSIAMDEIVQQIQVQYSTLPQVLAQVNSTIAALMLVQQIEENLERLEKNDITTILVPTNNYKFKQEVPKKANDEVSNTFVYDASQDEGKQVDTTFTVQKKIDYQQIEVSQREIFSDKKSTTDQLGINKEDSIKYLNEKCNMSLDDQTRSVNRSSSCYFKLISNVIRIATIIYPFCTLAFYINLFAIKLKSCCISSLQANMLSIFSVPSHLSKPLQLKYLEDNSYYWFPRCVSKYYKEGIYILMPNMQQLIQCLKQSKKMLDKSKQYICLETSKEKFDQQSKIQTQDTQNRAKPILNQIGSQSFSIMFVNKKIAISKICQNFRQDLRQLLKKISQAKGKGIVVHKRNTRATFQALVLQEQTKLRMK